ncbi:amino acid adenylation domain-containing protein [filamentous cyanobacterium LEGE 11480]|uniref:Amino acid adenylation domain-containing protein n=1 Tax=Romeriopsis navalis LEGE 11480 TaxID=2777977 RepID=A0A928Z2B1_9CYAN|nr:amino acid adenylation domain-containing protein [Romeriopsis navalis]MBE9028847.1 amino acid adenylation domain-containing protein [Romeriopsis navalis LEGE 11480]
MMYHLSQILDRSAAQFADREAFRCDGAGITYRTLQQQANGLAHWLVDQGVKRGDRVGIYLNKSLETAIAVYGIWKAGAAYVPLDPSAPITRTAEVINHCGIRHLLTQKSKRAQLPAILAACPALNYVLGIPDQIELPEAIHRCDWSDLTLDATAPKLHLMEQDLAYIMYTSGSTGTPKGIMHTHRSGLNYAQMAATIYGLKYTDRLGNHSPLHFDMSTLDYFAGPLVGATTVIIPEAYTKLPASLSQLVQDEELTVWYSVPFALIQLLLRGVLDERNLRSLRWVLFGGEPYPAKYMYDLMAKLPQAQFSNVYGPAEINQCSYYHVPALTNETSDTAAVAPIGKIWPNAEARVVNEQDELVPAGAIGELLVRTPTMMNGYWQRPDLNEQAFYRCTIAHQAAVFYRTGDLVQQQTDGNYQFIGRKDRQIKARGYRIELDEVEAALVGHPQVEAAAAYAVPHAAHSQQIEAAVILQADSQLAADDLISHAAAHLPTYAVPKKLIIAPNLPRTGTGKIDRTALKQQALQQQALAAPS